MRCAVNNLSAVKGDSHGIDPDYRCPSAAVWRRWRILWSQARVLVIERRSVTASTAMRQVDGVSDDQQTFASGNRLVAETAEPSDINRGRLSLSSHSCGRPCHCGARASLWRSRRSQDRQPSPPLICGWSRRTTFNNELWISMLPL